MKLELALNGRFLLRSVTGVERLALELTRAMRLLMREADAADIEVLAPPAALPATDGIAAMGAPPPQVISVGQGRGHGWEQTWAGTARPRRWLLSLCNIGPMMRRRQAVVICDAQFVMHPESYSAVFRWWYRVVLTVLARRARVVFTISDFSKAALERYGIVPRDKAHVLRLGIDHLRRLKEDNGVLARCGVAPHGYVLAIGSLARHKNLATLVEAFVAADLSDITLLVAGGGNPRVFKGAGLPEASNIIYTGRVTDEELKALYANALAFACPSLSEGFGFTPLEAMSMGCPVVATTGGAVPEVCGDAALYADPLDRAAWRDALRRITSDAALRDELRARANIRVAAFTWRATAQQVLRVLAAQDGDDALLACPALHN